MKTNSAAPAQDTSYLLRPEGRIGYDVGGVGPLIILVPGMGDLRAAYRFLAPELRAAGYRVASTDLRGHGDSDSNFASYGDVETASDIVALVEELGGPAIVVGNSMGAGAAAFAAADRPELIDALILVGPFVRNGETNAMQKLLLRVAMARPWVALSWNGYLPKLYKGTLPDDFSDYRRDVVKSLRRPGYAKSFSLTTRTDHTPAEQRLGEIKVPTLVIMGEKDPDFPDPRVEADWIGQTMNANVVMVPNAGHYPQSQQPRITTDAVLSFLETVARRA
jgi:pimeloyl-ACP methyl ester carboxylesterase